MWINFLSSIQFLTTIPVGKRKTVYNSNMLCCYPLVGLIIGLITACCDYCFSCLWPVEMVSLLDVLVLVILSGALHLDGVGDTADGIFSHRTLEKKLLIMKDSRIGSMGLIAVFFVLSLKWTGIRFMDDSWRSLFLIIIPAYSRTAPLFGMKFIKYGRPEGGIANVFFKEKISMHSFAWVIVPMLISIIPGWLYCLSFNLLFIFVVFIILLFYKKQMNCITGDMLGAMIEITEVVLFLIIFSYKDESFF
ncbi:Adenosylcobinamide-GDP ribazoletransferase [Candidatus Magnetomoraceae bacterium gMMP-15]